MTHYTKTFNDIKAMTTKDCLLNYNDKNKPYVIEKDDKNYHIGDTIK